MRRSSFPPWRRSRSAPGTGKSAWQFSWPRRDEIRPIVERWFARLQQREVLDRIYLGALALVLAFAAYLMMTG